MSESQVEIVPQTESGVAEPPVERVADTDPALAQKPSRARYGVLFFLCSMAMLLYIDRICIGQAGTKIKAEFHLNDEQFALINMAFLLAYTLFEVPTGHWGDRFGCRGVISRIVVCWSVFTALTGAAFGLYSMMAIRFLFGAGEAGAFPNAALVVTKWFPTQTRGLVRGLITTTSMIGGAVGPPVAAFLIDTVGWRWTFATFGAVGLVWSAAFYWWYRDTPAEHPSANEAEIALIGSPTHHAAEGNHRIPWGIVLSSPNVWLLGTIMMAGATLFYMQFQWYPTYLKEARSATEMSSGWLTSIILIGGGIGCVCGGLVADFVMRITSDRRWGRRLCGALAMACAGLCVGAVNHVESATAATLCNAGALFFVQVSIPTWWTVVAEVSGRYGAAMFGLMNSMGGFGTMGTTYLVGRFVTHRKALAYAPIDCWTPVFNGVAVMLFVGAVLWLMVDSSRSIVERSEPAS